MAVLLLLFSCLVTFNSFVTPWTVAHQAPLSMGFPRQEYWSGLPFPFPGDLPNPRIELASPALAGKFFTTEPPGNIFFHYWREAFDIGNMVNFIFLKSGIVFLDSRNKSLNKLFYMSSFSTLFN